jgi:ABC-2 type transport system permease protein
MAYRQLITVLVRMKFAVLRHILRGQRNGGFWLGVIAGLVAITATVSVSRARFVTTSLSSDFMALAFGAWTLGWIVGPVALTGEDQTLRPEHFRSLPLSARELASGLLAAAFVGLPAAVTFLAFASLVLYAVPFGVAAVLVAVAATALELIFAVVLSRVVLNAVRQYLQSHLSALLSGILIGALTASYATDWALFATPGDVIKDRFPETFSVVLHALPSSGGVVAVDAAGAGRWPPSPYSGSGP